MTITLNDEQTRLICEVVKVGAASSTEEAVDKAVRAPFIGRRKEAGSSAGGQSGRSIC